MVSAPVVTISTGTSGVAVSSNQNWNALMYALGSEKTRMQSMLIWSDNPAQLTQPITFVNVDPNGKNAQKVITPAVDNFQTISQVDLKTLSINGKPFQLDGQNQINYDVLPNTNIRMAVVATDKDSVTAGLISEGKIVSDFVKVLSDLGVGLDFLDEQTWKEELPVKQKMEMPATSIMQKEVLQEYEKDDMLVEMENMIDSINENMSGIDIDNEEFDEDAGLIGQEKLNADADMDEAVPEEKPKVKNKYIKPVAITAAIIGLGGLGIYLYYKYEKRTS